MPEWVKDHDLWEKAKRQVNKDKYKDPSEYYAVVTHVYKNMGGGTKHKVSKYTRIIIGIVSS